LLGIRTASIVSPQQEQVLALGPHFNWCFAVWEWPKTSDNLQLIGNSWHFPKYGNGLLAAPKTKAET
jgi:hypothetical protein